MPRQVTCIFCRERGARAKEHAIPQWLQEETGLIDEQVTGVLYSSRLAYMATDVRRQVGRSFVSGGVCEGCNTGWMNDLENSFRPIFSSISEDSSYSMSIEEQQVVGTWSYKTALMINRASNASRRIPATHFRHLYEHRVPPQHIVVHLAHLDPLEKDYIFEMQDNPRLIEYTPNKKDEVLEAIGSSYQTIISFNHIMFRVIYFDMENLYYDSRLGIDSVQVLPVASSAVNIGRAVYPSMYDYAYDIIIRTDATLDYDGEEYSIASRSPYPRPNYFLEKWRQIVLEGKNDKN